MLLFNDKKLDKSIPTPLYYQLKTILLDYIKDSHVDLDKPIPTEMEISNYFNISRPTVRQAINSLVVEGYLYRVKSKGTFISKPKINQDFLLSLDSFNNEMKKKGMTPSTKVLSTNIVNSDEEVSNSLKIPVNSKVIELIRLRFADDEPIVLVTTYLPYDKCAEILNKDLETESLYEIIEKDLKLSITRATRSVESVLAGEYEAKKLRIEKGSAIQYFESIVYLSDGTPIEYSLAKYRGDRNKFIFEIIKK